MSRKLLKKENLTHLSHDDLIKLGASLIIGHLADDMKEEGEDEQSNK